MSGFLALAIAFDDICFSVRKRYPQVATGYDEA